jgi:CDP-glycerol glycerophosphotransferase (TagB/SpsB family)/glycosyltransferase involved in cell wall biosynthesis
VRKTRKAAPIEWRAWTRSLPVEPDHVLYEAFAGRGVLDSPEALFRAMLADPAQSHRTHIWALKSKKDNARVVQEFANDRRVRFVKYRSPSYFKALATAGLLVNNATFPADFNKREGQVYVNTWHGTPIKHMGYDEPQGAEPTRNVVRNFAMADYLLSSGSFMTERMYEGAFRLVNLYQGRILEHGFPRTDRQVLGDEQRTALLGRLRAAGVHVKDKVVLYAPTWRGESFYAPTNDARLLGNRVRALRKALPDDVTVLLKVHQQVYEFAQEQEDLRGFLVPNDFPTNEVLGVADVLVTDYSSIFFDFLATGRPVVFFVPDREAYAEERGLYLRRDELPGPMAGTVDALAELLNAIGTGRPDDPTVSHASAYAAAQERFASHDDGAVCRRVLDIVLNGRRDGEGVREVARDSRERLLVFLGGMKSNGITTSALNLLANLDYERFDVTAVYDHSNNRDRANNAEAIDPRVRRLARVGSFAPGKRYWRERRQLLSMGAGMAEQGFDRMLELLDAEWRRCFGPAEFDYVVDFSGYSPFWSFLLTRAPARSHSIWMHNDLLADQQREIEGHHPHRDNLASVFTSYRYYDHLVSVSESLKAINARNLGRFAAPERFAAARNTIDHERILRLAHGSADMLEAWGADPALANLPLAHGSDLELRESAALIAETHGLQSMQSEIERRLTIAAIVPPLEGVTTFVTIGRLSPEKNHERLLRAFDLVHQDDPDTRLVLVGYGPLAEKLHRLATELGLAEAVTFAGLQRNPFTILAHSDVFVLSSDYEGQPMVILEALVLGKPVVTTSFESVAGALPPGTGLVVDRDHHALAEGMRAAKRGEVPNPPFDPVAYNREAMADFYRAIGADGG